MLEASSTAATAQRPNYYDRRSKIEEDSVKEASET